MKQHRIEQVTGQGIAIRAGGHSLNTAHSLNNAQPTPTWPTLSIAARQEGTIDILDVGASERLESVAAHSGPVWSLAALPDGSGFVSGSADHDVKFWEWEIVTETTRSDAECAERLNT